MASLDARSKALRRRILDMVRHSRRGHIASGFSLLEIVRVLYDEVLRYDPKNPSWDGRDRFVFSKGHGCMGLYVLLAEKGFFPDAELDKFCEFEALLGGHPEHFVPGVEAATGSLGHGLSIATGMALAARIDKKPHRVFALLGDGECAEGSVWEAAISAGKFGLSHLTAIVDRNRMQCYGSTEDIGPLEPFRSKWESFGWAVREVDGHDVAALREAFAALPLAPDRPSVLIASTVKGKGVPTMENNPDFHHTNKIGDEALDALYAELESQ
ncbi:MAG: transketolase [Planctomycetes bacterium]|nr:transketolase [Planctomycetota bacterium]